MSYGFYYSMPLPHSAVGWSAVCDCGITWSYSHFLFDCMSKSQKAIDEQ